MKQKSIHFLFLLLILSIASIIFISCNTIDKSVDDTVVSNTPENFADSETQNTTSLIDNLINADFDNETFTIYGSNKLNAMEFVTVQQFSIGSEVGEPVNDTLYQRDRYIEEKYNITIQNIILNGNPDAKLITNSVLSGDKEYDAFYGDGATIGAPLYYNKVLVDMYTVPYINFDADYWQQSAQESLTIDGKLYFATGSITPRFFGAIYLLSFNKVLYNKYNLPNFYDLALNNKWTIDAFMESCRNISTDTDGNSVMDENDLYGFGYEVLTPETLYIGCGYNIVDKKDGELTFSLDDPDAVNLIQKMKNFFQEDDVCFYYDIKDTDLMFIEGNLLFNNPALFVLEQFRDMEDDYGILPMPLLNESQEHYYSYAQPWANSFVYIPVTNTNLDLAGTIIEAMAVYGDVYIKPAIYNTVLLIKGTRDEESAQTINLMMSHIRYDMAPMFNFAEIYNIFKKSILIEKENISSLYAANEASGKAALEELLNVVR